MKLFKLLKEKFWKYTFVVTWTMSRKLQKFSILEPGYKTIKIFETLKTRKNLIK